MAYEIGTYIDLTYLNRKREVASKQPKKSFESAGRTLYEVGTSFVFRLTPSGFQAAIKIPVAMA